MGAAVDFIEKSRSLSIKMAENSVG